ncbi:hypothetical protein RDI58_024217 [Solanum bulbocastanum]|uniref:Uncharacterized protein n=1 Tax=Solanum bulbocastanum TaxID=147425 RepID=A0AAN8SX95_SOLBU
MDYSQQAQLMTLSRRTTPRATMLTIAKASQESGRLKLSTKSKPSFGCFTMVEPLPTTNSTVGASLSTPTATSVTPQGRHQPYLLPFSQCYHPLEYSHKHEPRAHKR